MRIKFTKLIPIALVSLVLIVAVACKQKNVKKIVVHNQFAISLYSHRAMPTESLRLAVSFGGVSTMRQAQFIARCTPA